MADPTLLDDSRFQLIGAGVCTAGVRRLLDARQAVVIGRHPDCTIAILSGAGAGACDDLPLISRQHAVLEQGHDGRWTVYDNHSENGTSILHGGLAPSVRLEPGVSHPLESGDVIELAGRDHFRFLLEQVRSAAGER